MKATDLSKIIYECDIHALTDYYSFVEVEYDDTDNDTISVFRHGYDCKKHVPKGMYLWFSPNVFITIEQPKLIRNIRV